MKSRPASADRVIGSGSSHSFDDKNILDGQSSSLESTLRTSTATPLETFDQLLSSKKRKRTASAESIISRDSSSINDELGTTEKCHAPSGFVGVRPPPFIYPKSLYASDETPLLRTKERFVLKEILVGHNLPRPILMLTEKVGCGRGHITIFCG